MLSARDLRQKTVGDLRNELQALGREAFNLRMQQATSQLSRHARLRQVRRDIARVLTVINEKVGE
jgi:large subunit ribosomal protein L29